jgi:hypothetical protein
MRALDRRVLTGVLVLGALGVPFPGSAQQAGERPSRSEKPLVSETIQVVLERDGAEAARQRFQKILQDRTQYRLDQEGLATLGAGYFQRGEIEKGQTVMDILLVLVEEQARAGMASLPPPPPPPPPPALPTEPPAEPASLDLGPTRTDLGRFLGVYGDPARQGVDARHVLIRLGCNGGRLEMGGLWGPVSPWVMTSVSDLEFEQGLMPPGYEPIRLVFETGPDGRAAALRTSLLSATGDLVRVPRLRDPTPEEAGLTDPMRCVR